MFKTLIVDNFKNGFSKFKANFDLFSFSIGLDFAFFTTFLFMQNWFAVVFFLLFPVVKMIIEGMKEEKT